MPYLPAGLICAGIVVLALFGMWWGWRRRRRVAEGLGVEFRPSTGETVAVFDGLYVATTRHDAPLDRLAIPYLGFRSKAQVTVTTDGVALDMPAAPTFFLGADQIVGAGRATWTIDRVVERDGLVLIAWTAADGTVCDSYIRLQSTEPDALVASVNDLKARLTGAQQ